MTYELFISYASSDLAFAEKLHQHLTDAGFSVWFDKARLQPGCDWHREIEAGCEASRILLPVLTPRWKLSDWTKFETYGAETVIPLIVEGSLDEIFTPPLTRFQGQAVNLLAAVAVDGWERLLAAIRGRLAQPQPDKRQRLADVRFRANPYFIGREQELLQIHEELHQSPTAMLTQGQVRAIAALGGVGKTTLVRQYAEKFWRCYSQLFWVDCRIGVEREFARLCDLLLPNQRESTNVPEKAQLALHALQTRDDRLLILDNAEDEVSIQAWIPKTGSCRTLITSRFAGWSAAVKSIHLHILDPEPSRKLLATRAGREAFSALSQVEGAACEVLAKKLGYLPLALEQAAAYIEQQGPGFGFADYLRLYESATADLLAEGVLGSTEYPDSVITTWKATTAKLSPAGRGILQLCAYLSPASLPLSALFDGIELLCEEATAVAGTSLAPPPHPEIWVRKEIRLLRAYSMVESDGQSLALHPLVQTVQRLQLAQTRENPPTLLRSLHWMNAAFKGEPQDVRDWPILEPLAPHVRAVAEHAERSGIFDPTTRLFRELGVLFVVKALYADAELLFRRALTMDERHFGVNDPRVAEDLNNLAVLLSDLNRLGEAEPLVRRALDIGTRTLGPDHPRVALRLLTLSALLRKTCRYTEAEEAVRQALAIDEKHSGPHHPDVASDLAHLALLLREMNRLTEAEALCRRALDIDERHFGSDHPRVASDLDNLAELLRTNNKLTEAELSYRRAVDINQKHFGMNHIHVANVLHNLALLLQDANRLAEAEPLCRRVIQIMEESLGIEHPDVACALLNYAGLLRATNRAAEAEQMYRKAVGIYERGSGPDHPHLATALSNLALLLRHTNRLSEAESLLRRAVSIHERHFGPDSLHSANSLNNLALVLQDMKRVEEAEPICQKVIRIVEEALGPAHPRVGSAVNNLALVLKETHRLAESEQAFRRALKIFEEGYGPEHPEVATVLNNLAEVIQYLNRREEAEPLFRRALHIDELAFGPDDPVVAHDLNDLAVLLRELDRLDEAVLLCRRSVQIFRAFAVSTGHEHRDATKAIHNLDQILQVMGVLNQQIEPQVASLNTKEGQ